MLNEAKMTSVSVSDVATFIGREVTEVLRKSSSISADHALTVPLPSSNFLKKSWTGPVTNKSLRYMAK